MRLPEKPKCCEITEDDVAVENDKLQRFIDEECSTPEEDDTPDDLVKFLTKHDTLYNGYKRFMKNQGRPLSKKEFIKQMQKKGIGYRKFSRLHGQMHFTGITYDAATT
jgi:phage/plasmid-associated DNA primase